MAVNNTLSQFHCSLSKTENWRQSGSVVKTECFAAVVTTAKTRKQPKCPSTDERIKKRWYIDITEYYSAIKKNKMMPFAATWLDLEIILLSEISYTEKDKYHMISHIWGI